MLTWHNNSGQDGETKNFISYLHERRRRLSVYDFRRDSIHLSPSDKGKI